MNTRPVVNEFVRFGIVGIAATALHYGIYYLLQPYINVNIAYTCLLYTSPSPRDS